MPMPLLRFLTWQICLLNLFAKIKFLFKFEFEILVKMFEFTESYSYFSVCVFVLVSASLGATGWSVIVAFSDHIFSLICL